MQLHRKKCLQIGERKGGGNWRRVVSVHYSTKHRTGSTLHCKLMLHTLTAWACWSLLPEAGKFFSDSCFDTTATSLKAKKSGTRQQPIPTPSGGVPAHELLRRQSQDSRRLCRLLATRGTRVHTVQISQLQAEHAMMTVLNLEEQKTVAQLREISVRSRIEGRALIPHRSAFSKPAHSISCCAPKRRSSW